MSLSRSSYPADNLVETMIPATKSGPSSPKILEFLY